MSFEAATAARALLDARRDRRPAGPLPAGVGPQNMGEAIAAQVALAHLLDAMPPAGFKIGATTARMQAYLGLEGPMAGFMPKSGIHESGVTLPWAAFRNAGVECEIGVRLARPLHAGCDPAGAAEAVGDLFAAIEIVENRYGPPPAGDLKRVGTETLLADQVYHAAAVLGRPGNWATLDLGGIQGRLSVDAVVRGEGRGAELLGHPMQALAWLANSAEAAAFGGLRAGQVVMLGSVTPPIWLDGTCEILVEFDGLEPVRLAFS